MSYRRLAASAAVLAAGVALVPAPAHAADPAAGRPEPHGIARADLVRPQQREAAAFTSPADRSVRQAPAAGRAGAASADAAQDEIAVSLKAFTTSAHGMEVDATTTGTANAVSVSIDWGDGTTSEEASAGGRTLTAAHQYGKPGGYTVRVTVTDGVTQASAVNQIAVWTQGSHFTPHAPKRLLDTRNGTGAYQGKLPAYGQTRLQVGGNAGIPAGVTAVVLNVTVTNTTSGGHITAYPDGGEKPTTSNVNFAPGQTVPNLVIVPVGRNGYVNLHNGGWEGVDLIADVTGYFTKSASSGYTPMDPQRLVDTRNGTGAPKGRIKGYGTLTKPIGGLNNATAVALNVTVTNPGSDGHLTVFPGSGTAPAVSNLNFSAGQTIANAVIVPVGAGGEISIRNGGWNPTDVIVDIVGYYSPTGPNAYVPLKPDRLLDTRDGATWSWGPLSGRGYVYMPLGHGFPHTKGFVLNTTVTNPRDAGHLAVAPDPNSLADYDNGTEVWPPTPTSSTLNWTRGKTVPNLVQAGTGPYGIIDVWNQSDADIDLVVDLFGLYEDN
ncbi:PKD domain-containing protein [Streptomyces sp. enrichment culture]|uniref:PKD domain-containing protein n=1 Tax=Streptomyces sp. enrichment culture TaxID=1795815 RepID=UPI003F57CE10